MASGTVRVNVSHNADDVIADVQKVKTELHDVFDVVMDVMKRVAADARVFVLEDAEDQGDLRRSIGTFERAVSKNRREIGVQTDASIAPHAALIEFGTGARTEMSFAGSVQTAPSESVPPGYPFETPDIAEGTAAFSMFVSHLGDWMERKGIEPRKYDSIRAAATAIAKTIIDVGQYAHPFLRPAWFKHEIRLMRDVKRAVRRAAR